MTQNRLPLNQENPEDKQKRMQEELQRRLSMIMDYAVGLYDLLEPGMTVEVKLEEPQAIIAPHQNPPKVKRLYITRPAMALEVQG